MSLKELFKDLQLGQSSFQNYNFVVAKTGITKYGEYKQALRELYSRYRAIRDMVFKIHRLKLEIKKIQRDMQEESDELNKQLLYLDKREKELLLEESYKNLAQTKKEFIDFYEISRRLKDYLGNLSDIELQELEAEYWKERLKLRANIELKTLGTISSSTLENILVLPSKLRIEILGGEHASLSG